MKTYQITEEQVKKLHFLVLPSIQEEIEQWFPEAFNPDYVGKWCKSDAGGIWFIESVISYGKQKSYGFSQCGSWIASGIRNSTGLTEAGPSEVEKMLRKEAERKYKVGDKIKSLIGNGEVYLQFAKIEYLESHLYFGNCVVFKDGVWAEVIPQPATPLTIEQIEEKLGYKIKIVNG